MIRNTFLHLPGIGPQTERRLWRAGYREWDALWSALRCGPSIPGLFRRQQQKLLFPQAEIDSAACDNRRATAWIDCLDASRHALAARDYDFFLQLLPSSFHWRLLPEVLNDALFLDIETTGLSHDHHYVTVIGALHGDRFHQWVWPQDIHELDALIQAASAIITFNGRRFDVPFLRKQLPELRLNKPHIDLLYSARFAGFSGGQKAIEERLGLQRPPEIAGLDGAQAVTAWCAGLYGNAPEFRRLLAYNRADVEMMPRIAMLLFESLAARERDVSEKSPARIVSRTRWGHKPSAFSELRTAWLRRRPEFSNLQQQHMTVLGRDANVVGIDLRAKAERPTGWALCRGRNAQTRVLFTDDEILEYTLAAKPDLVSIDAPLSLPRGRECVWDDSPCREQGGIVRDAERILWSRGIRVYPALIRQMQGLTARGIELTRRLEENGVAVIESYPGAAQDVLNIPRKKTDESLLAQGLRQFGYRFSGCLTHDELDAITSALVGHFYLAGRYEALGADDEGYMIVPKAPSMTWCGGASPKQVVSFLGIPGAGKTTLAKSVAQTLGWRCFILGDALRDLAISDEQLRNLLGRGELAPEPIVISLIDDAIRRSDGPLILDGFPRHICQCEAIRGLTEDWSVVLLDLPPQIAAQRMEQRRACADCGNAYFADETNPCAVCGGNSVRRRYEDTPDVIFRRLGTFKGMMQELVAALPREQVVLVDSNRSLDLVLEDTLRSVESLYTRQL